MAEVYKSNGTTIEIVKVVPIQQTGTHIATINGKAIYAPTGGGGGGGTQQFNSLRDSDTLAQNERLTLSQIHVQKNITIVCKITGTLSSVNIGVGYKASADSHRGYNSRWIELTPTNVVLHSFYSSVSTDATYPHGITLTNKTTAVIQTDVTESGFATTLKLFDDLGNVFTQELPEWGVGIPFVENGGATNIAVDFSVMLRDITKDIWCFGDSYFSFTQEVRWPYYARGMGNIDWFSNNQPGLSPTDAYTDLQNILALGYKPVYLLWALGMNGATTETQVDGEYVINSSQKTVIDNVLSLCQTNGIIPIFCCIPTVPERQKTGFCKYIRSLGTRYVDFAESVGTNEQGQWNTGLLSSDDVHPTALGAKVLYSRLILDFPEIAIKQ